MEIRLLGGASLTRRGRGTGATARQIATQPKRLAVLTYLALTQPQGFVRRDAVLALLWPELETGGARNALSQAIHGLRRDVGEEIVLVRGHHEVGLSPDRSWCDAVVFQHAIERQDYGAAVSLYRGELLPAFHLPGDGGAEFERWLDAQRARLRGEALRAALRQADREESHGRPLHATRWLRRALDVSPTDEVALRRLVSLLDRLGNRAAALLAYEEAAARMRGMFELDPSPETEALVAGVRSRRAAELRDGADAASLARASEEQRRLRAEPPAQPEARAAFLRGRYLSAMLPKTAEAIASFTRAIALDPGYAPAHAGLAMCYANLAVFAHVPPAAAAAELAAAARRALELDEGLSDAHVALGLGTLVFDRNWRAAETSLRRAVELNPGNASARAYLAVCLSTIGDAGEGVTEAAHAAARDPLDPWATFVHGFALYRARCYAASLERLRLLLELYPHHALAHLFVAENELKCGRPAHAAKACRAALVLIPDDQLLMGIGACVLGLAGRRREARRWLGALEELASRRYVDPAFQAAAHVGLGQHDAAFACWRRMVRERAPGAFLVGTDPLFDVVRPDPRFQDLLQRLGFNGA